MCFILMHIPNHKGITMCLNLGEKVARNCLWGQEITQRTGETFPVKPSLLRQVIQFWKALFTVDFSAEGKVKAKPMLLGNSLPFH